MIAARRRDHYLAVTYSGFVAETRKSRTELLPAVQAQAQRERSRTASA